MYNSEGLFFNLRKKDRVTRGSIKFRVNILFSRISYLLENSNIGWLFRAYHRWYHKHDILV